MPPDLALLSTLTGSNYPCLELIFMFPKVFEPLMFNCIGVDLRLSQILGSKNDVKIATVKFLTLLSIFLC